jgi:hypothetical protein
MDIKILRDLCEAYSGVYTPQELTEEQIWEEVENWVNSLIEEGYDLSDYSWEEMYEAYIEEVWGAQRYQRTGPSLSSKVKGLFKSGADSTPRTTGIYGQPTKKPEAPKPATTPAGTKPATTPAATTPAATTPAATTPAATTPKLQLLQLVLQNPQHQHQQGRQEIKQRIWQHSQKQIQNLLLLLLKGIGPEELVQQLILL